MAATEDISGGLVDTSSAKALGLADNPAFELLLNTYGHHLKESSTTKYL